MRAFSCVCLVEEGVGHTLLCSGVVREQRRSEEESCLKHNEDHPCGQTPRSSGARTLRAWWSGRPPPDAQRLSKRWLGGRGRLGLPLGPAPGVMAFYIPGNRPGALKYGGAPSDSWGASGLPVKAEFKNGAVAS